MASSGAWGRHGRFSSSLLPHIPTHTPQLSEEHSVQGGAREGLSWCQGPAGEAARPVSRAELEEEWANRWHLLSPPHDFPTTPRWEVLLGSDVLDLRGPGPSEG